MWNIWFSLGGVISLVLASIIQSYQEFGKQAKEEYKPKFFNSPYTWLLYVGWMVLLLVGGVLIFFAFPWWYVLVGAIVVFWLLLPFSVGPRLRKRLLPPWDDLKKELEPKGYNEHNYWRGNWWKESR